MPEIRTIDQMPTVNPEELGELPNIPEGTVLYIAGSPWRKGEKEMVAGAVITACIRAGSWQPIPQEQLINAFVDYTMYRIFNAQCRNALVEMFEQGDIDIVEFGGEYYTLPTLTLIEKALRQSTHVMFDQASKVSEPREVFIPIECCRGGATSDVVVAICDTSRSKISPISLSLEGNLRAEGSSKMLQAH